MHNFDALVLGGGAAGLLCAIEARKRGRRVAVLQRDCPVGKKILTYGVRAEGGESRTPALVVATGGLSIRKMGATSYGYQLARQFGLHIVETKPALVPFVLAGKDRCRYCDLAGVSADVVAKSDHHAFR